MRIRSIQLAAALVFTLACGGSTSDDPPASNGGAGGGSAGGGGAGAGGAVSAGAGGAMSAGAAGAAACFDESGVVPSIPFKLCKSAADCDLAVHAVDCCGNQLQLGVAKAEVSAFSACEKAWSEALPKCGCPSEGTKAEDGKSTQPPALVIVVCTNMTSEGGICKTMVQ